MQYADHIHQLDQVLAINLVYTRGPGEHFRESYQCFTGLLLVRRQWRACVTHDYARESVPDVAQTFREHFSWFQDSLSSNSTTRESESEPVAISAVLNHTIVRLSRAVLIKSQNPRRNSENSHMEIATTN